MKKITLGEFKTRLEGYGNNEGAELIHEADPLIDYYRDKLQKTTTSQWGNKTFETLLAEYPTITGLSPAGDGKAV